MMDKMVVRTFVEGQSCFLIDERVIDATRESLAYFCAGVDEWSEHNGYGVCIHAYRFHGGAESFELSYWTDRAFREKNNSHSTYSVDMWVDAHKDKVVYSFGSEFDEEKLAELGL